MWYTPVSYTHLDVYKRQDIFLVLAQSPYSLTFPLVQVPVHQAGGHAAGEKIIQYADQLSGMNRASACRETNLHAEHQGAVGGIQ